jgi:hypothetical protein
MNFLSRLPARILGFMAILLLAGCAATRYEDLATSLPPPSPGEGRIVLYTPLIDGASVQPRIRVNKRAVGRAKPGSFFYVDRAAGTYTVLAQRGWEAKVTFELKAGETRYVRFVPADVPMANSGSGSVGANKLKPELASSATQAQTELSALKYWGASSRTRNEEGVGRDGRVAM